MKATKKLIEVALPLEAINEESLRRKQKAPKGWPTSFHKWWAQRPLAAARAVIFAQMVDDPSTYVDVLRGDPKLRRSAEAALKARLKLWQEACSLADNAVGSGIVVPEPGPAPTLDEMLAERERQRLFGIIEELVLWDNTADARVVQAAQAEIWQSWRRACAENADHPQANVLFDRKALPAFLDPFAGSGSLPLSAQWLGLESYAGDINPVAVLINKAMVEIPHSFEGAPPVNSESRKATSLIDQEWEGTKGLAEDVRAYGRWMGCEAEKRIGHLYPKATVTPEMAKERADLRPYVGRSLTVIAWLWARTVRSPNPAFASVDVPLVSNFMLSTKAGREAYIEPIVEAVGYSFAVRTGKPDDEAAVKTGTKLGRGANFRCVMSGTPFDGGYIQAEGRAGRMGSRLMAIVAEGDRGRVYLTPTPEHEAAALAARPAWKPEVEFLQQALGFRVGNYGMTMWSDLFTDRQLVALTTFADLVQEARERATRDALASGLPDEDLRLRDGGTGAAAYAEAVSVYLACVVDRMAYYGSTLVGWLPKDSALGPSMPRQVIGMTWDFAEASPLGKSSGDIATCSNAVASFLDVATPSVPCRAFQSEAQAGFEDRLGLVISTDPPYYDNVGYADLSDFFYVWLRRSLRSIFPDLFATLAVPKAQELVATPARHGGRSGAEAFFLEGMTQAMHRLAEQAHPAFPMTIYYAFKQAEDDGEDGSASTGWETFLAAVITAGFSISGTWPLRTEGRGRMRGRDSNALASSIIVVCRRRAVDAPTATRREFVSALKAELPVAIAHLQRGNIAPVDLAQAAIGPGMAVYTRYAKVLDAEGKTLSVREALALINQTLDEALAEQEGDFDADSRWALTWFEQSGFAEGEYGVAETLATARNTSMSGLVEAGIVVSSRGKVRLLRPDELPADWDPTTDARLTAWEIVHHLIRVLDSGGEGAAAELFAKLGAKADIARELAYRLYTICDRPQKKRVAEALAYNGLVQSLPEIARLALEGGEFQPEQGALFGETEG